MAEPQQQQQPLRILALGDSLTAGYFYEGWGHHPYTKLLKHLFESAKIPVHIEQRGISGECVVPTMLNRLRNLLKTDAPYDWIIILGGTNDIGGGVLASKIFKEGLEPMYDLCLNHSPAKTKLAVMTVTETSYDAPTDEDDKNRQALNSMIRDYVAQASDQKRICLVDLDKGIPFHSMSDYVERRQIWDDGVHLTPAGYDRMAVLV